MAYLRNVHTNETLYLLAHHTFGRRKDAVDTCIQQPEISKIHCVIEWNGERWRIRDLGRNGTWLNNEKLPTATNTPLKTGNLINFANSPHNQWQVESIDPPKSMLQGLNDLSRTEPLTQYHLLPDAKNPKAALFLCGKRGQWVLESLGDNRDCSETETLIPHNGMIRLGQHHWRLLLNEEPQHTVDILGNQADITLCEFIFEVSLDEEHTKLSIRYQNEINTLGERSHHYLLLHLARLKFNHARQGLDASYQGWISNEQLAKEMGIGISHINIQIFRARKQITEALPNLLGINELVERRRGEVRFNCPQAKINKGEQTESLCFN